MSPSLNKPEREGREVEGGSEEGNAKKDGTGGGVERWDSMG
jgi:hypothetical protein